MEKSYFLSMTFNNIVFRGRNQAYGAYVLRKAYSKHMFMACILATATFAGALVGKLMQLMFFAAPEAKYKQTVIEIVEPYVLELPPPPAPEPEEAVLPPAPPKAEEAVATEKFTNTTVVSDDTPTDDEMPDQSRLSEVNIGTKKISGTLPAAPDITYTEAPPTGIEGGTGDEATEEPKEFVIVDQMPMFEGGEGAMLKYLGRKLRYPSAAQKAAVEGIVVVSFIVDQSGSIKDAKVIKGLGFGTDEEALRVINSMPTWQPGKQNGRAVPVRFTLPIRFSLE